MNHEKLQTKEDWEDKIKRVCAQFRSAEKTGQIHCRCGKVRSTLHTTRCFYCHEWFCSTCAEEHYGKTMEEFRQENPVPDFVFDLLTENTIQ